MDDHPPACDLQVRAEIACDRTFEAIFSYLQDEECLWSLGEQAIGIFWDPGQLFAPGPRRSRALGMSITIAEALASKLSTTGRGAGAEMPSLTDVQGSSEWIFEALGQLWFRCELGLPVEPWLVDGCGAEWNCTDGSMAKLVGFSAADLSTASLGELTDLACQTWTLERSVVCGLFQISTAQICPLEYGIEAILAEVRNRPLIEPPLDGFFDCFYLMTHIVYVLNCFNGYLPNRRSDCPWLYAYLERSLEFWLREVQHANMSGLKAAVAARSWSAFSVDAVAEAVDCLRGLGGEDTTDLVRRGMAFLLSAQEDDDLFRSPGCIRPAANAYDHVHPSWTAVAALQFDRSAPSGSTRCEVWAKHARSAAQKVGFCVTPPRHTAGLGEQEQAV